MSLSTDHEVTNTYPPVDKEQVTSCDGDAADDGAVVGLPPSKKAKIETGADNETIDVTSASGVPSEHKIGTASTSGIENNHSEEGIEQQQQQQQDPTAHPLDSEEVDFEEEEANSDDEELFQQILALARAGRIPVEYLAAHGIHVQFDDDEPVEYPFEKPPKSVADVADFIRSEKCQRIMVLAG